MNTACIFFRLHATQQSPRARIPPPLAAAAAFPCGDCRNRLRFRATLSFPGGVLQSVSGPFCLLRIKAPGIGGEPYLPLPCFSFLNKTDARYIDCILFYRNVPTEQFRALLSVSLCGTRVRKLGRTGEVTLPRNLFTTCSCATATGRECECVPCQS